MTKLTYDDAELIRELHKDGKERIRAIYDCQSIRALAVKFEVAPRTIESVLMRLTHKKPRIKK